MSGFVTGRVSAGGGASTVTAGNGLTASGGVFNVATADATLTVNADSLQVNLANVFAWTAAHTLTKTAIGTAQTAGYSLINSTAAAAGAQQYSPMMVLQGQGWKTDATASSQAVAWAIQTTPVQGAANPTSTLDFLSSINGAAYSSVANFNSAGDLTTTGHVYIPVSKVFGIGASGGSAQFYVTGNTFAMVAAAAATNTVIYGNLAAASTGTEVVLRGQATRTDGLLLDVQNNATSKFRVGWDARAYVGVPNSAPTDSKLAASEVSMYLNEAGNTLTFRVKYSDGTTLKSGTVALA